MNSSTTSFSRYLVVVALAAFLVAASAVVLTELLVRFGVEKNHNIFQHAAHVKSTHASCAAFGDSHTALGFSGSDNCVNFGYPGETFADTASKFEVLGDVRMPQQIILQVDPLMFSARRLEPGQRIHMNYILGTDQTLLRIQDPLHRPNLIRYWRTAILKQGFTPVFEFQPSGWLAFEERWGDVSPAEREVRARREVDEQTPIAAFSSDPTAQRLSDLLTEQVSSGREVCMVSYPMSSEFTRLAAANPSFNAAREFFAATAADLGVRYVDMLDWRDHPIAMFANADHLNTAGAPAFTKDVLARCGF